MTTEWTNLNVLFFIGMAVPTKKKLFQDIQNGCHI